MSKRWTILAVLCCVLLPVTAILRAQTEESESGARRPAVSHTTNVAHKTATPDPTPAPEPDASAATAQPPQIIVNPPAAPTPEWGWREQATWAATIVLAVLGYVGIMLALRTLKRIDRHLETGTATAQAALESSRAALALAQAITNSERPWIVVTVEPFLTMEDSFKVMASNRGRSPARIIHAVDQVYTAVDETQLPSNPVFETPASGDEPEPIVLLPGEATGIWAFNREDLPAICKSTDALRKVERWQETLFLYGRLTYTDLNPADEKQVHETYWCCRYIHGEKSGALVMAERPEYNRHS